MSQTHWPRTISTAPSGCSVTEPSNWGRDIVVRALSRKATLGTLSIGPLVFPCALGRSGLGFRKHEGDGVSPIGRWPVRCIYYRPDRVRDLLWSRLPGRARPLRRSDGWCDAPEDRNYNRRVKLPYPASAETLWREDSLYDVILVLGHNDLPRRRGAGSAIFMHLAGLTEDGRLTPTAGCVALRRRNLAVLIAHLGRASAIRVVV